METLSVQISNWNSKSLGNSNPREKRCSQKLKWPTTVFTKVKNVSKNSFFEFWFYTIMLYIYLLTWIWKVRTIPRQLLNLKVLLLQKLLYNFFSHQIRFSVFVWKSECKPKVLTIDVQNHVKTTTAEKVIISGCILKIWHLFRSGTIWHETISILKWLRRAIKHCSRWDCRRFWSCVWLYLRQMLQDLS